MVSPNAECQVALLGVSAIAGLDDVSPEVVEHRPAEFYTRRDSLLFPVYYAGMSTFSCQKSLPRFAHKELR